MIKKIKEIKESPSFLLKFNDGNELTNISYDSNYYGGYCSTCNYGEHTITSIILIFNNDTYSKRCIEYQTDGDTPLISESDLIIFFTTNIKEFEKMDKEEFIDFIKDKNNII